jgi:hypothetical protein
MLQLFHSIFSVARHEPAPYPPELIERAIERTVDGTDPRQRALSGYQKKLRGAVIHALDHVVSLVDSLPAPLALSAGHYVTDPELCAYFASVEHLHELLAREPTLNAWHRSAAGRGAEPIVALLLMEQHERQVFGVALEGDRLRHDVAQTTISFARHRLVDPTGTENETRRLLKRRAFDHLLTLALGRLAASQLQCEERQHERALLRRKLTAFEAGRWGGFDHPSDAAPGDPAALQHLLEDVESQLDALRVSTGLLTGHLDLVMDVLMQADYQLWSARTPLVVDVRFVQPFAAIGSRLHFLRARQALGFSKRSISASMTPVS